MAYIVNVNLNQALVEATSGKNRSLVTRKAIDEIVSNPSKLLDHLKKRIESAVVPQTGESVRVGLSVHPESYANAVDLAAKLDFSVNQVIRIALEAHLQKL